MALIALGVAAVVALLLVLRPELLLACVALVVLPLVFTRLAGVARDGASATVLGVSAALLLLVGVRLGTLFGRCTSNFFARTPVANGSPTAGVMRPRDNLRKAFLSMESGLDATRSATSGARSTRVWAR